MDKNFSFIRFAIGSAMVLIIYWIFVFNLSIIYSVIGYFVFIISNFSYLKYRALKDEKEKNK